MSLIKILHVVFGLGTGGTEQGVRKLLSGLDRSCFEQVVCTVTSGAAFTNTEGIRVISLDRAAGQGAFLVPALMRAIANEKPHVVHSRNWGTIEAVPAARLARVPAVIHSEHGRDLSTMGDQPWRRRQMRRACYAWADRVFTVSKELRQYYATQLRWPEDRFSLLYNGVDTRRYRPDEALRRKYRERLGITPDTFVAGTVGRLDPVKDHKTLIRSAAGVVAKGTNLRLVIVGDGVERAAAEGEVAAHAQLQGRVTFVGESADVCGWLNSFDAFVLPSISEGMSNTLLEAMAVGTPAIASDVGGNPEVIEDGRSGLLFPAGDVEALTAHLCCLAEQPALRLQLGTAARRRIENVFSLERMLTGYAEMYCDVLKSKELKQPLVSRAGY
jgi:sugar transferase (PEP-CTERM/EpsH1 system associated)